MVTGHVHGDANARNFLFDREQENQPEGLQFIDCGCCTSNAPLVFDLAQMESDLKIALLGTEDSAPDYRDIDCGQLKAWIEQEAEALDTLQFQVTSAAPSISRAYRVVRRVRDRAAELSKADQNGRAYLFCLLYWTLRKLRHATFPHVKRVLALYSACRICSNMTAWQRH